jgi:hypothetical protein
LERSKVAHRLAAMGSRRMRSRITAAFYRAGVIARSRFGPPHRWCKA